MVLDFNIVYSLLSKFERAGQEETPSTPIRLVREMLDKLPPENWSDPSKTFLDPACSTGTFLLEIVRKLNIGLASQMPDQTERLKHILTKQIWGLELSRVPFFVTKAAFEKLFIDTTGIVGEVNIYHANALDGVEEIKDMKFDVVVGNPPYQAPKKNKDTKDGANGDSIWPHFVRLSFSLMKSDGYICFVHPATWRKPQAPKSKVRDLFSMMTREHNMLYLSIHNQEDGKKTFNAGTRYDWYVAKNEPANGDNTTIRDEKGKISETLLSRYGWLPNSDLDVVLLLVDESADLMKPDCKKLVAKRYAYGMMNKKTHKEPNDVFCHPLIHSTPKKHIRYYYSSTDSDGHFGISKAIFGDSGINHVVVDVKGEYGMTEHAMAIPIESREDGESLKEFLMSDKFQNILKACSWSNYQIDRSLFESLKEGFWRAQNE